MGTFLRYNRNDDSVSNHIRNQRSVCQGSPLWGSAVTAARPLRADAERNRQRVLEVAQQAFAAEGLAVPIDEIARRAGLGVGTLYRHFPTKEALFEAIIVDRLDQLAESAKACAKAEDPGATLFDFLSHMAEGSAAKKDFHAALVGVRLDLDRIKAAKVRVKRALGVLVRRAQSVGAVRSDVDADDVMILVMGALHAADPYGASEADRKRLLAVVFDGLRAR